jgi:uncharacterized surface protein with fasciclin (FAS1) repeats
VLLDSGQTNCNSVSVSMMKVGLFFNAATVLSCVSLCVSHVSGEYVSHVLGMIDNCTVISCVAGPAMRCVSPGVTGCPFTNHSTPSAEMRSTYLYAGGARKMLQDSCSPLTIALRDRGDVTIFNAMVKALGLDGSLDESTTPFTVLVPNDAAFSQYFEDSGIQLNTLLAEQKDLLDALVKSHIIKDQIVQVSDFEIGNTFTTLNADKNLVLKSSIDPILVAGDIEVCNGQAHVIDYVIKPAALVGAGSTSQAGGPSPESSAPENSPSPESSGSTPSPAFAVSPSPVSSDSTPADDTTSNPPTVTEETKPSDLICSTPATVVQNRDDTKIFNAALKVLNLEGALQDTNELYTLLVPSDAAFVQFLEAEGIKFDDLIGSKKTLLDQIVRNHIIVGQSLQEADFTVGSTYLTLNDGQGLKLGASIAPIIEQSDISSCGSTVHIINMVLVPSFADSASSATTPTPSPVVQPATSASATTASGSPSASFSATDITVGGGTGSGGSFTSATGSIGGGSFDFSKINISG